ncbi:amidohydrolase family protein [Streptomyces kaniharaensis]|uniref:Amidohydrolase n=1 Tax=Streptomyces kaniharaensis TaxID=212423 RepID=A0A5S8ZHZ3_9ACTN|nr:amidohydrolase family protein [Streptomyces kaniharaensis]AVW82939.1 amidohydrolase [Streptomyces kaniharaensis]MQS11314.1 amidohydrolase family protein [Streptomyces kaniharaensis]QTK22499.1 amidohydrolase [Streptomyces kaniharaensis]
MGTLAVTGAGCLVSGDLTAPLIDGADTVLCVDGLITAVGRAADLADELAAADRVLDAAGATVAPGLIDSHGHVAFGDYSPRQKAVDYLEGYVHGGITRTISAGEVHVPGRPRDRAGVKALAVAARASYDNFRPGGMRVHAGNVLLEPSLDEADFEDLARCGVWLAKFGFGAYEKAADGVEQIRWAKEHGLVVMCHAGGASAAGSASLGADDLLALDPNVCGHTNGGPTALPDGDVDRLLAESRMALQIVQAGNLRAGLRIVRRAVAEGALERIVLGSDTPSGFGVIPLAVLKTVVELSALGPVDPARVWALATGNVADVWGLPAGRVRAGDEADLVLLDAPRGSAAGTALEALAIGDMPGISAVVTAGEVRFLASRNTPRASRPAVLTGGRSPITG